MVTLQKQKQKKLVQYTVDHQNLWEQNFPISSLTVFRLNSTKFHDKLYKVVMGVYCTYGMGCYYYIFLQ